MKDSIKSKDSDGIMMLRLIGIGLIIRLLNVLISRTFFQPDEYYQSLEPAHSIVFGYGYQTWEWRSVVSASSMFMGEDREPVTGWKVLTKLLQSNVQGWKELGTELGEAKGGIRSPLGLVNAMVGYYIVKYLGLEETNALVIVPQLIQATLAAISDVAVYSLAERVLGKRYALAAFICSLTSFFNAYVSTRTFSNSTETALTTIALSLWPWSRSTSSSSLSISLAVAAIASILRPSNAIIWLILGSHLIYQSTSFSSRFSILVKTLSIAMIAALLSFVVDTVFYQTPTFTPYSFLRQNVINSISSFYGLSSSHYYLTQALPIILFTQLPFFLHGIALSHKKGAMNGRAKVLRYVVGGTIGLYSLLGHKEWRFIYPLLPILHLFTVLSLVTLFDRSQLHISSSTSLTETTILGQISNRLLITPAHFAILFTSLLPAIYLTSYHSIGQVSVMNYLRTSRAESEGMSGRKRTRLAVLMPCHSTPWMSHLHWDEREAVDETTGDNNETRSWFLECEPPILGQNKTTYRHQEDFFYDDPFEYIRSRFPSSPTALAVDSISYVGNASDLNDLGWNHDWPSYFILFDSLFTSLPSHPDSEAVGSFGEMLISHGYILKKRIWNSHFHEEKRSGDILVLELM